MTTLATCFASLDDEAVQHYAEHGYVVVRNLLSQDLVRDLLQQTDDILGGRIEPRGVHHYGAGSNNSPDDPGRLNRQVVVTAFPAEDDVYARCAEDPSIVGAAAALLDYAEPAIFQLQAMVKEPGSNNPTPWHQDDGYWRLSDRQITAVTAWMPLLPTTAADGTMWILPDSHHGPIIEHVQADGISDYRTINKEIDESKLVALVLEPGDVSFHHQRTVHGAFSNAGKRRRVAIASHYASTPKPWESIRDD